MTYQSVYAWSTSCHRTEGDLTVAVCSSSPQKPLSYSAGRIMYLIWPGVSSRCRESQPLASSLSNFDVQAREAQGMLFQRIQRNIIPHLLFLTNYTPRKQQGTTGGSLSIHPSIIPPPPQSIGHSRCLNFRNVRRSD